MCHGAVLPSSFVSEVAQVVREHKLQLHVDGARIFNAAVASNSSLADLARPVDSLSVCLSKGLCCPIGTLVLGDRPFIQRAARLRKALGGGLRQAGFMAATGVYALKHMVERLRDDHERAYLIARTLHQSASKYVTVDLKLVQTNIVYLNLEHLSAADFCDRLMQVTPEEQAELGGELCKVRMLAFSDRRVRFLTSNAVNDELIELVLKKLIYILNQLEKRGLKGLRI
jgi:threonine aldolase